MRQLRKELMEFTFRGNLVDLAVAVVIGGAFGAAAKAFVSDLLTPLISIPGHVTFQDLTVTVHGSVFRYGDFLNTLVTLILIALALFFFVAKPIAMVLARRHRDDAAVTRDCPECLSTIPVAARRCAHCTAEVTPAT